MLFIFFFLLLLPPLPVLSFEKDLSLSPQLLSSQKIWDQSLHAAFTDLIYFQGRWYCAFRESNQHAGGENGKIRIIESSDGKVWHSTILLEETGVDLRDPKLSITPNDQLMLLVGGSYYSPEGQFLSCLSRVAFSKEGKRWSPFTTILEPFEWLWRVTWHQGSAYGISYRSSNISQKERTLTLFSSRDGIHYEKIKELEVTGLPSEATLHFLPSGEMVVLVRRRGNAWIGIASPPFQEWQWKEAQIALGSPNYVIDSKGSFFASGRVFEKNQEGKIVEKTILAKMSLEGLEKILDLPSGGDDTSYPGMVFHEGILWISYYSSHEENKASIFLAKIQIND